MQILEEFAARVAAMAYDGLPGDAIRWAKMGVLDYIGVTVAGSAEPAPRLLAETIEIDATSGRCVLFGQALRANALDAALINGTASHALDFDDISNTMGGHPSAPILPALFAIADTRRVSGRDFLLAYIAGFEVETKIARGVHFHHYTKGWHPTSTLGIFGAAAACGRLLGLDAAALARALALAASMAAGLKANFGTMTKPLHVGQAARNGLFAARLAARGFTANPGAMEHVQGFLEVFNGAGTYDVSKMFEQWAAPLDIVGPGIAIKQYPCCGSIHPALDAMLGLVREHDLAPERVVGVRGWLHPRRLQHTNRAHLQSNLDAKFSLQYCLARAVVDRKITLQHFQGEAYAEPAVVCLMKKIEVAPYDSAQFPEHNHFGGEVAVDLDDGSTLHAKVDEALGRTSDNPLPHELIEGKLRNCCEPILSSAAIESICRIVGDLEHCRAVSELAQSAAAD